MVVSEVETQCAVSHFVIERHTISLKKVPWTHSPEGVLKFDDKVLFYNKVTDGTLSFYLGDRITSHDEAYACTTNPKSKDPLARALLIIKRVDENDGFEGNTLHFGQKIRL